MTYAVLLVLPAIVLGYLQWKQIENERQHEFENLPAEADDAARRVRTGMRERVDRLLFEEDARPFHHYARYYCPDETCSNGVLRAPSPLVRDARPPGVLGWFSFDMFTQPRPMPNLFLGGDLAPNEEITLRATLDASASALADRMIAEGYLRHVTRLGEFREVRLPLAVVAAHCTLDDDPRCIDENETSLREVEVDVVISPFEVAFYFEGEEPRVVASRRVYFTGMPMFNAPICLRDVEEGFSLVQGFFIDPRWLFDALPQSLSRSVLGRSQRFVPMGAPECCEGPVIYHAEISPVADLGFETLREEDRTYGRVRVAVDSSTTEARFRQQRLRFAALASMLGFSLGTGLWLLLRSVSRELENAARTENFVAAVTHELRTPLSTIKLHGEMLLDGWAKDPEKQREYHRRIVRETERLSTMVERVLEKARLSAGKTKAAPGDLNRAVAALEPALANAHEGERSDLVFELAPALPPVMLSAEAVSSIVTNLVENARKYAAVDWSAPDAEPLRVVTRVEDHRVLLEVHDRGPGVAPHERKRIFEAFYRVGDERTRTARGTGLGLHLVHMHAQALGGDVQVENRPGGGAIFRVAFAPVNGHAS